MLGPERFTLILFAVLFIVIANCALCADEATIGARDGKLVFQGARVTRQPVSLRFTDTRLGNSAQALSANIASEPLEIKLDKPLGAKGTVSFLVRPKVWYRGGGGIEKFRCDILKINRVGKFWFQQQSSDTLIAWDWDWDLSEGAEWIGTYIPELPGPEWYHLIYTWDAQKGLYDAYFNGYPQRTSTSARPWTMASGDELLINTDLFDVADVRIKYDYMSPVKAVELVPRECKGKRGDLLGYGPRPKPVSTGSRLGRLLYQSSMDDAASLGGWVMEGPGVIKYEDDWMEMSSPLVNGEQKGHVVYWCPQDFPASFVAEWEVKQMRPGGFCIVFFAAKGEHGEDIFDPKLPMRDGTFKQYTSEAITSYHISYCATSLQAQGRTTSNLRKNNHFYLVANGPAGVQPGDMNAHKVRLIKDEAHIQLQVDGEVIIDYTDDSQHYGPPYGEGKIGMRQMEWTKARYRNFKVWELNPE